MDTHQAVISKHGRSPVRFCAKEKESPRHLRVCLLSLATYPPPSIQAFFPKIAIKIILVVHLVSFITLGESIFLGKKPQVATL